MGESLNLVKPKFLPPLDEGFRPAVSVNRAFQDELEVSGGGRPLVLALERTDGSVSRFETRVFPADHPRAEAAETAEDAGTDRCRFLRPRGRTDGGVLRLL